MFEAELRVEAFQNGSFVADLEGRILRRAEELIDDLALVDLDLGACASSTAR